MAEKTELIIQTTNRNKFNFIFFKKIINEAFNKIKNEKKIANIKNNPNINKVKRRDPGIDLVRILAMWSIIIHHVLFHGKVLNKYNNYKILNFINICSFWHVNSFSLVSGIIGYKTNKYSNLLYLWFWVVTYQVGIHFIYKINKKNRDISPIFFYDFFPVIYSKYWYFTVYFGMYLFLPIINKGISSLTKNEHKLLIFSFYGIYNIWNDYMNQKDVFGLNNGYSIIWFIISYITGAYIGKYKNNYIEKKKFISFPILVVIYVLSSLICYKMIYYEVDSLKNNLMKKILLIFKKLFILKINSIPMILQSISIIFLVMNINYNKYIGAIICFFGPLTFGIYLIHEHELIRERFIKNLFSKDSNQLSKFLVIKLVFIRSIYIFFICSFIDYLRYIIFKYVLRIKTICIFIEKNILKLCT